MLFNRNRNILDIDEYERKDINEWQRISMNIFGYPRISTGVHAYQCASMDTPWYAWVRMGILANELSNSLLNWPALGKAVSLTSSWRRSFGSKQCSPWNQGEATYHVLHLNHIYIQIHTYIYIYIYVCTYIEIYGLICKHSWQDQTGLNLSPKKCALSKTKSPIPA